MGVMTGSYDVKSEDLNKCKEIIDGVYNNALAVFSFGIYKDVDTGKLHIKGHFVNPMGNHEKEHNFDDTFMNCMEDFERIINETHTVLGEKDFTLVRALLDNPPEPTEAMIKLMKNRGKFVEHKNLLPEFKQHNELVHKDKIINTIHEAAGKLGMSPSYFCMHVLGISPNDNFIAQFEVPNEETLAAINEVNSGGGEVFNTADELFDDLEKVAEERYDAGGEFISSDDIEIEVAKRRGESGDK